MKEGEHVKKTENDRRDKIRWKDDQGRSLRNTIF
jgi:hypothetical protein